MMTHRELLAATKRYAREDRWLSWWHLGTTLAVAGGLLAVVCSEIPWFLRLPFSVALGLTLVRFFVLYHDHQHGAILRGSRTVDWIMWMFGMTMLNPPGAWKRSHNHHHAHNSRTYDPNTGSFPLLTVDAYRKAPRWRKIRYVIERHPLTILLGYLTIFFGGMCLGSFIANPRRHIDSAIAIIVHGALLVALLLTDVDDLWLALLVPCSIASAAGAYLFYAQHNFPGVRIRSGADWDYVSAALESSSYMAMGPVMRWFTANIGYHHVHHLNSQIPFYRLPEAMAGLQELQSPTTITLSPRHIWGCLRLKLWDPDSEQLVPWSALKAPPRQGEVGAEPPTPRIHGELDEDPLLDLPVVSAELAVSQPDASRTVYRASA